MDGKVRQLYTDHTGQLHARYDGHIYHQSCEHMWQLPDNSVDLMVTSPPYNVGKSYETVKPIEEHLDFLDKVWRETYRVLKPGGRACINVANLFRQPYIPVNAMITMRMLDMGFLMRGELIWDKGNSVPMSTAWGSWCSPSSPFQRDVHEYIMVFCKDHYKRNKKDGVATISKEDFLTCSTSIWKMETTSATHVGHPAPFPMELPRRLIELYTYRNDLVLDPFMGSGTTAMAAIQTGRRWVGYELVLEYIYLAHDRIGPFNLMENG